MFLVYFVGFCVFSAEKCVLSDVFDVRDCDRALLNTAGCAVRRYIAGSVWMRPRAYAQGVPCAWAVYYRPEFVLLGRSGKALCYKCRLAEDSLDGWPEELNEMVGFLLSFASSSKPEGVVLQIPRNDVMCAVISGIKAVLSETPCLFDGYLHPRFSSWAHYVPVSKMQRGDKCLFYGKGVFPWNDERCANRGFYTLGSVWISFEDSTPILCYKPDFGPGWVCYRYDLESDRGWPRCWLRELWFLRSLARTNGCESFVWAFRDYIVSVVKAVLSGRSAQFDEFSWFAWKPHCADTDPFLQRKNKDVLLEGEHLYGVYQRGCVWSPHVWSLNGDTRERAFVLCYRSLEDEVFQFNLLSRKETPAGCGALQGYLARFESDSYGYLMHHWSDFVDFIQKKVNMPDLS